MIRFVCQPQRTHQRHFCATTRPFAHHCARPQISNRRRSVRVFGIELGQFFFGFLFDPRAPLAHFVGELLAVFRDVFEYDFVEQYGNRIEIAGEGICAYAQGFERNGSAAGKGVYDERARTGFAAEGEMRGGGQRTARRQIVRIGRVIPVGKICDEIKQRVAQHVEVRFFGGVEFTVRPRQCLPFAPSVFRTGFHQFIVGDGLFGKVIDN